MFKLNTILFELVRLGLVLVLVLASSFYLKWGYGLQGQSLVLGCGFFVVLGLGFFLFEVFLGRKLKEFLIPVILGTIVGFLISDFCVDWIGNLSFLSPVLGNFPWQPILKLILTFGGILFFSYWSQERFSWNKFHVSLRFQDSKDFQMLRWILRVAVAVIFLIFLLSFLRTEQSLKGERPNVLALDMINQGYDFNLEVEKKISLPSLLLWGIFGVGLLSEWVLGNLYLRWIWVLLPGVAFTVVSSGLGMEMFGTRIVHWIPNDLFQLFFIILCGYLSFSWSLRAMMTKSYRLPFLKIDFEF